MLGIVQLIHIPISTLITPIFRYYYPDSYSLLYNWEHKCLDYLVFDMHILVLVGRDLFLPKEWNVILRIQKEKVQKRVFERIMVGPNKNRR